MFKLGSLVLGVTLALADHHVNKNEVDTNYFVGLFNGNEFALAMDTCNPLDVTGASGFQSTTCVDSENVQWQFHLSSDCTDAESDTNTENFNATYWQTGTGTYGDFECDGSVDAYAEIEFSIFTCSTSTKVTMHAAIGVCTFTTDGDDTSINVYCEPNWAELQYYDLSDNKTQDYADCDDDLLYQVANATDECGFMVKTGGIPVFGVINDCVAWNTTEPPTTTSPDVTGSTTESESGEASSTESGSGSSSEESSTTEEGGGKGGSPANRNIASVFALVAGLVASLAL